jgi:hypothetical protein
MLRITIFFLFISVSGFGQDSVVIRNIYNYALTKSNAYNRLDHLCNEIGPRLSGSKGAEKAVNYTRQQLIDAGADSVWLQPCKVEYWERGMQETGWYYQNNKKIPLHVCALGGSIATPFEGLEAEVIEIYDFKDLEKIDKEKIKGRIVFINHPMDPTHLNTFQAYGECGGFRYNGAKEAAAFGAAGVIVRSLSISISDFPHTGAMAYGDIKIPACAVSTRDAESLSAALKNNPAMKVGFQQTCRNNGEVTSYNVIAEIRGREYPDEIIIAGGHLDSWDLATGAHDDGAGVVQSMEVISTFKKLNLQPKRTVRCVLFMNEEMGGRGALAYAAAADSLKKNHIAAIESDRGGFTPRGFTLEGDHNEIAYAKEFEELLKHYSLREWLNGYSGTDIRKLEKQGTLLIGYSPDSQRYFDIHHNAADTFDKVNKRELELGAASMTSLVWLLSEHGVGESPLKN